MRRSQCNYDYDYYDYYDIMIIMISAYKSMYGQDRRITHIHMLSANESEYFDIYFSMSAMDTF